MTLGERIAAQAAQPAISPLGLVSGRSQVLARKVQSKSEHREWPRAQRSGRDRSFQQRPENATRVICQSLACQVEHFETDCLVFALGQVSFVSRPTQAHRFSLQSTVPHREMTFRSEARPVINLAQVARSTQGALVAQSRFLTSDVAIHQAADFPRQGSGRGFRDLPLPPGQATRQGPPCLIITSDNGCTPRNRE